MSPEAAAPRTPRRRCHRRGWLRGSASRGDRRLDELDENATGVLRVDEVDPAVRRTSARLVVEQADTALPEYGRDTFDVGDPVRQLLEAGAVPFQELRD